MRSNWADLCLLRLLVILFCCCFVVVSLLFESLILVHFADVDFDIIFQEVCWTCEWR